MSKTRRKKRSPKRVLAYAAPVPAYTMLQGGELDQIQFLLTSRSKLRNGSSAANRGSRLPSTTGLALSLKTIEGNIRERSGETSRHLATYRY